MFNILERCAVSGKKRFAALQLAEEFKASNRKPFPRDRQLLYPHPARRRSGTTGRSTRSMTLKTWAVPEVRS